jgi:hypothetical protein
MCLFLFMASLLNLLWLLTIVFDVVVGRGLLRVRKDPSDVARRHRAFFVRLAFRLLASVVYIVVGAVSGALFT